MRHLSDAALRFIAWQHREHYGCLPVDVQIELNLRGLT